METTIIGIEKGYQYFVGHDKGERLKMSRKVLKNWGRPLSYIFQFEQKLFPRFPAKI
jgi:DNA-binding XRE family transcriptional regulator